MSYTEKLFDFIESSPTACHTVETLREILLGAGFTELYEQQPWELEPGNGYFTARSMTSLIAFRYPKKGFHAFSIVAPHGDAPLL